MSRHSEQSESLSFWLKNADATAAADLIATFIALACADSRASTGLATVPNEKGVDHYAGHSAQLTHATSQPEKTQSLLAAPVSDGVQPSPPSPLLVSPVVEETAPLVADAPELPAVPVESAVQSSPVVSIPVEDTAAPAVEVPSAPELPPAPAEADPQPRRSRSRSGSRGSKSSKGGSGEGGAPPAATSPSPAEEDGPEEEGESEPLGL